MSENPNGWNHRIVQAMPCGCVVGVTTYEGISEASRMDVIRRALEAGNRVSLVPWDDLKAQWHHCDRYPHEQWQVEYERRLAAFKDGK